MKDKLEEVPLVSVWMVTYNHEKFIRESLESVMAQNVNFNFEVIIGDDASTDGTRTIIKEFEEKYPNIIRPVYHSKNVGPIRNAYEFCFPKLTGKYIACLECDDYWTDVDKLQKQVNFLEQNCNYSICWTKYQIMQKDKVSLDLHELYNDWNSVFQNTDLLNINLHNIFNPYITLTLTVMFRKAALNFSVLYNMKHPKDNAMYCLCLTRGKGAILNFFGGVYRIHQGGTYSGLRLFSQRYSSFLNLEEIVKIVPNCNNRNLKSIRNFLLFESYSLATSEALSKSVEMKLWEVIQENVIVCSNERKN